MMSWLGYSWLISRQAAGHFLRQMPPSMIATLAFLPLTSFDWPLIGFRH